MTPADRYRTLADDLKARAEIAGCQLRAEWLHLAECYRRLAEEVDRHERGMPEHGLLPRW